MMIETQLVKRRGPLWWTATICGSVIAVCGIVLLLFWAGYLVVAQIGAASPPVAPTSSSSVPVSSSPNLTAPKSTVAPADAFRAWYNQVMAAVRPADRAMKDVVAALETMTSDPAGAVRMSQALADAKRTILIAKWAVLGLHPPAELNATQRAKLEDGVDDLALAQDKRVEVIDAFAAYLDSPRASLVVAAGEASDRAAQLILSGVMAIVEVQAELGIEP